MKSIFRSEFQRFDKYKVQSTQFVFNDTMTDRKSPSNGIL